MTNPLSLRSGVGFGQDNLDDDTRQATASLTELSFEPRKNTADPVRSQITEFQADSDLAVDGVMRSGGPTEQKVNIRLAKKRARDRRTLGGMLGDADIENPVGAVPSGAGNRRQDLVKAADALAKAGQPPRTAPGATSIQLGNTVAAALRRFQRTTGLSSDGVMTPDGPTQAALS